MIKTLKKILHKLSKKISRKNLYKYIDEGINIINKEKSLNNIKVLNVGAGGEVETFLKSKFDFVKSIDIDKNRNPDQLIDICNIDQLKKLSFTPQLICMFEVLEHSEDPISGVNNLYEILDIDGYLMCSTPFIFHIHDEPYDFFRFTKYGLESLFRKFNEVNVKARNGWFETILILFVRLRTEKNLISRLVGNFFVLLYFILSPITYILQKLIRSDKITTGYFLSARK